jgi:hypothetical protein
MVHVLFKTQGFFNSVINLWIPQKMRTVWHAALFVVQETLRYTIRYLLIYSIEQIPWEAKRSTASQEILHILWKPKVYYRNHKRPPPVPILNMYLIKNPSCHIKQNQIIEQTEYLISPQKKSNVKTSHFVELPKSERLFSPAIFTPNTFITAFCFINHLRTKYNAPKRSTQKAFSCCDAILETGPAAPQ